MQSHEDCLDGDVLVAVLLRYLTGFLEHLAGIVAQVGITTVYLGQACEFVFQWSLNHRRCNVELLQDELDHTLALAHHSLEDVHWLESLVAVAACKRDGLLQRLLRFDGKIV